MANFLRNLVENDKAELRRTGRIADQVMALEDKYKAMSDEELRAQTAEFKKRLEAGTKLDDLLVEAFAVVREADRRVLGLFPYRVQIQGGIVIQTGRLVCASRKRFWREICWGRRRRRRSGRWHRECRRESAARWRRR